MWKDYSVSYIKNNKTTSISIMIATLIAAMFLSLITSVFYNIWIDNINQIVIDEGDWQGKLIGNVTEDDIKAIESFANVKDVVINKKEGGMETSVYFYHMRSIYEDMPKIATLIGKGSSEIMYHDMLLSEYFIFAPDDEQPPMLLAFYVFVMLIACISLILIIRNAFEVSMNARLHQLGILQSIGATPRQIRSCLLQEALGLCIIPILVGILAGVGLCFGAIQLANGIAGIYRGENAVFSYHAGLFFAALLAALLTVLFSAWIPARKLSRLSPLQVIKGDEEQKIKKEKKFRVISSLFGVEGELARKSLYARRKAFRTSSLSLTLSLLAFSIFLCFNTLSRISTKHTYFERYKDSWDLMITVENQNIFEIKVLQEINEIEGVESCTAYQKALVYTWISEEQTSGELKTLGGIDAVAGSDVPSVEGKYRVKVPVVILDDDSFKEYYKFIGAADSLDLETGMVTINRIWDNVHSNFRYKQYVPFVKEMEGMSLTIFQNESYRDSVDIPILAYTDKLPVLKEEYVNYGLLQIMSTSTWQSVAANMNVEEKEMYINLLAISDDRIQSVQSEAEGLLSGNDYEIENRVKEERYNAEIQKGYTLLMGGLCGLLAFIGLANVFSNALGCIYQRRREFARYLSIGLTPQGVKKVLFLEALIIGGKPILITIPLTVIFIIFAVTTSYLNPIEFLECMPIVPLLIFAILIFACVGLAYYIGGKKIYKSNMAESLRDDTFV
ncbi:ABC transporter permease [Desnuesiella massiliensis]|uniref:ABC transporter permease n=1 Tax=Desnuesiella massiliensis TaxID=1650662 RepID=UPI0006E3BE70|nr:ABC transporter permease [Desnuesiella massiliensis]